MFLKDMDNETKELFRTLAEMDVVCDPIPWGGALPGKANFMYGLRGENHPSSRWHKEEATKEYYAKKRNSVMVGWMNSDERRKQHSEKMKERWASGKITADQARQNGKHGLTGKDNPFVREIEYEGKTYYGWRELKEATGVTKHLYNKYYKQGIDPTSRIGADGPAAKGSV